MAAWAGVWDEYSYIIAGVFCSEEEAFKARPGLWTFGPDQLWHLAMEDSHLTYNYELTPAILNEPLQALV